MNHSNTPTEVNAAGSSQKSTYKAADAKKTPTGRHEKTLTRQTEKTPSYYSPSGMVCPVDAMELKGLLLAYDPPQREWCSNVRLRGLLILIAHLSARHSVKGFTCSADLAHQCVSKLGRAKSAKTIKEPLAVLVKIGLLKVVQEAVNSWHIKNSAIYSIREDYTRFLTRRIEVALPPKLTQKREQAEERREKRLCRNQPFRARLLVDLKRLGFGSEGRSLIGQLLLNPNFKDSILSTMKAVDGKQHSVRQTPRGQITTSIGGCPKELKPLLLLDGEKTVSCDISHAHHCFLPRILGDRIAHLRRQHGDSANTAALGNERTQLIEFLSEGDYYRKWCVNPDDDAERKEKKLLVNMILNWRNAKCTGNGLYQRMRRRFPLTFGVVEDIKRNDNRNISKQTQYFTAEAIHGALLEVQARNIAAIPDVDAIICQERHRETVCEVIGHKVHKVSGGVCCKVDGIRYAEIDEPF